LKKVQNSAAGYDCTICLKNTDLLEIYSPLVEWLRAQCPKLSFAFNLVVWKKRRELNFGVEAAKSSSFVPLFSIAEFGPENVFVTSYPRLHLRPSDTAVSVDTGKALERFPKEAAFWNIYQQYYDSETQTSFYRRQEHLTHGNYAAQLQWHDRDNWQISVELAPMGQRPRSDERPLLDFKAEYTVEEHELDVLGESVLKSSLTTEVFQGRKGVVLLRHNNENDSVYAIVNHKLTLNERPEREAFSNPHVKERFFITTSALSLLPGIPWVEIAPKSQSKFKTPKGGLVPQRLVSFYREVELLKNASRYLRYDELVRDLNAFHALATGGTADVFTLQSSQILYKSATFLQLFSDWQLWDPTDFHIVANLQMRSAPAPERRESFEKMREFNARKLAEVRGVGDDSSSDDDDDDDVPPMVMDNEETLSAAKYKTIPAPAASMPKHRFLDEPDPISKHLRNVSYGEITPNVKLLLETEGGTERVQGAMVGTAPARSSSSSQSRMNFFDALLLEDAAAWMPIPRSYVPFEKLVTNEIVINHHEKLDELCFVAWNDTEETVLGTATFRFKEKSIRVTMSAAREPDTLFFSRPFDNSVNLSLSHQELVTVPKKLLWKYENGQVRVKVNKQFWNEVAFSSTLENLRQLDAAFSTVPLRFSCKQVRRAPKDADDVQTRFAWLLGVKFDKKKKKSFWPLVTFLHSDGATESNFIWTPVHRLPTLPADKLYAKNDFKSMRAIVTTRLQSEAAERLRAKFDVLDRSFIDFSQDGILRPCGIDGNVPIGRLAFIDGKLTTTTTESDHNELNYMYETQMKARVETADSTIVTTAGTDVVTKDGSFTVSYDGAAQIFHLQAPPIGKDPQNLRFYRNDATGPYSWLRAEAKNVSQIWELKKLVTKFFWQEVDFLKALEKATGQPLFSTHEFIVEDNCRLVLRCGDEIRIVLMEMSTSVDESWRLSAAAFSGRAPGRFFPVGSHHNRGFYGGAGPRRGYYRGYGYPPLLPFLFGSLLGVPYTVPSRTVVVERPVFVNDPYTGTPGYYGAYY
jgi:hypothetical protein